MSSMVLVGVCGVRQRAEQKLLVRERWEDIVVLDWELADLMVEEAEKWKK